MRQLRCIDYSIAQLTHKYECIDDAHRGTLKYGRAESDTSRISMYLKTLSILYWEFLFYILVYEKLNIMLQYLHEGINTLQEFQFIRNTQKRNIEKLHKM